MYSTEKDAAKVQIRESKKGDGAVFTRKITYAAKNIDRREKGSVKPMKGTKKTCVRPSVSFTKPIALLNTGYLPPKSLPE
jgi:hypothetical protein